MERLILRGPTKKVAALSETSSLAWTPELRWFDCQLEDAPLAVFARSPHLHRVSTLVLEKLRCGDEGLSALARSGALPRLRRLELPAPTHGGAFTIRGVIALLEAAPGLRALHVAQAFRVDLAELAVSPALRRLELLSTGTTSRGPALALARSPELGALQELAFDAVTPVDDMLLDALLENPSLARLQRLSFRRPLRGVLDEARVAALRARLGRGLTIVG